MSQTHVIAIMPNGRRGSVPHGVNLLEAARQLGVELESICAGRQTCGKCQVVVEQGAFPKHGLTSAAEHLTPPDGREAKYLAKHRLPAGRRLACACEVRGDVLITVPEESQARKQIIAKAVTDRAIDVQPAVRQVYVELRPAELDEPLGDWERLALAARAQWGLTDLTLDPILLPRLQPALKAGGHALTLTVRHNREVIDLQAGYAEGAYGLAVDVGSTSIVVHLCDLRTGTVLATETSMNPQVRYGEDLMSRVSYGMMRPDGAAHLHAVVLEALNTLTAQAVRKAGVDLRAVYEAALVGNTIMHHLLLGVDPVELGGAPFALALAGPVDMKARDFGLRLAPGAYVHLLPCIAGHVGADHVAALLAEAPHHSDELMLLVDVGTNAEIALGDRQRVLCCSSPTGPAFEGAQITHGQRAAPGAIERVRIDPVTLTPRVKLIGLDTWFSPGDPPPALKATGICGSGIIEAVAEMFLAGLLDENGLFDVRAAERTPLVRPSGRTADMVLVTAEHSATGAPIVVTQNDVRAIQLGKAALYAGVKLLMAERGVTHVDRIALAGAFGSYIDPRHAMILGLIPDCDLNRVHAVGNAAGDGARMALLNVRLRAEAAQLARAVTHVQTATAPNFQAEFVAAMALPHKTDAFPHLAGQLPARLAPPADRAERRAERRQRRAMTASE